MNPEGNVYNAMGRINRISVLCIDAYGVAVKNGFEGTVEEWLASLKGEKGDSPSQEEIAKAVYDYFSKNPAAGVTPAIIGEITLLSNKWVGSGNLYSQVVVIDGVTENTQVDITPSVEQLVVFYEKDLTFVTENDDGVVTVYAIGQKPLNDYTIQVTLKEVL